MTMSSREINLLIVFSTLFVCSLAQKLDGDFSKHANNGICESFDIRNHLSYLESLRNCSVIVGHLNIVLLNGNFSNYVFPELREVTQYIIFYQAEGMKSIGEMFPNLALIRGQELFYNYALVVYQLPQLEELGLRSLTTIQRGYVRIDDNPQLCFSQTVNWARISGRQKGHHFSNNGFSQCPGSGVCRGCEDNLCWSSKYCQRIPSDNCHEECLGGCTPNKEALCYRCKNYMDGNMCVHSCPPGKFVHPTAFQCVTEEVCKNLYKGNGWTWNNLCIFQCPKGYKLKNDTNVKECVHCGDHCNVTCHGIEIRIFADAQMLKGCNFVNGSLQIRFIGDNHSEDVMQELENNLKDIREIRGNLKIYRSPSITSLSFLKSLQIIHGKELVHNRYSLIVHEMENLQTLWNSTQTKKISIRRGTMFFHYNAKLCVNLIKELIMATKIEYTEEDVCQKSNGYQLHCHSVIIKTWSKVYGPHNVAIYWIPLDEKNEGEYPIEYSIYYMEEPDQNITIHIARDTCYKRGWQSILYTRKNNQSRNVLQVNISNLKPFTNYAYYVETYYKSFGIMSSNLQDGQSIINFFTTKMEHPPAPINLYAFSSSPDELTLLWDDFPNFSGIITRHRIDIVIAIDKNELLDRRNYCRDPPKYDNYTPVRIMQTLQVKEILIDEKERPCSCHKAEIENLRKKFNSEDIDVNGTLNCEGIDNLGPFENDDNFRIRLQCKNVSFSIVDDDNTYDEIVHSRTKRDVNKPIDFHKILSIKPSSRPTAQNVSHNNRFHSFSTFFHGEHKNYTMNHLKHFGKYLISIEACKGPGEDDCGTYSLISLRTVPLKSADDIDKLSIIILSDNRIEIAWKEPADPNGAILSYDLEYKRVDLKNSKPTSICITRKEHEDNNWKYILKTEPGKYSIRVKAKSLADDGDFTQYYILNTEPASITGWVVFLVICIIFSIAASGYVYWRNKRRALNHDDLEQLVPERSATFWNQGMSERVSFQIF